MTRIVAAAVIVALAGPVAADGVVTYPVEGSFEDAAFAVENAIIERGLVVDFVSHVGAMLARTGADVGSEVALFEAADVYLFCAAVTSRNVMEADRMNIAHCPYGIFVADTGDEVMIGYRSFPEGPMQEAQALLDEIARDASGN
ncbi:DUF302 domain-containing protein [Litorisediminicola beolgyonensis]|uniref:DUF302 domain-containing protein n=1 Tax=Litorisediminicola beolgyonensis TaxID=1173614 RepID=A0ABW3ZL57_9RHOB